MVHIKKIKLHNFKRFRDFSVELDDKLNLFIGDNEAGKTSILTAIDLVLSGSRTKVESIGLENLFNTEVIREFLCSKRNLADLPELFIELYLSEQDDPDLNGKINSDNGLTDGLRLTCEPDDTLSKEIQEILGQDVPNFPFEYYTISFKTFSGDGYVGHRKFLRHVMIDNSQIGNEYATRDYVRAIYNSNVNSSERSKHQNEYRRYKEVFRNNVLLDVNSRISDYSFAIRTGPKANLDTDLTIAEGDINIENKGKGRQCFIKTQFALKKKVKDKDLDVVLIEEPENHLSHVNMRRLIRKIAESENRQLFVATHNDLICTRLDLRKAILLSSTSSSPVLLRSLSDGTAKFFMKAPDNNVLEYILSNKVILVEGDAEYILMDVFFRNTTSRKLEDSDVHVISVNGTSFKRYLELARMLRIKTAVIRDNDGDYEENCVRNYAEYADDGIRVFSDEDNDRRTFEIALYRDNVSICNELFEGQRRSLSVQDYMVKNKTEAAFEILERKPDEVIPPGYITEAIRWIEE